MTGRQLKALNFRYLEARGWRNVYPGKLYGWCAPEDPRRAYGWHAALIVELEREESGKPRAMGDHDFEAVGPFELFERQ